MEELEALEVSFDFVGGGSDPLVAIEELLYEDSEPGSWTEWAHSIINE